MNLTGKTAVITGSTRGIGKAIAQRLAELKSNIVIIGTQEEKAKEIAKEIEEKYLVKSIGIGINLLNEVLLNDGKGFNQLVKDISLTFNKVDILVNNAGITRDNLLLRMSKKDWDEVIALNLTVPAFLIKVFLKGMLKNKSGRIINISSIVGETGNAGQANYSASKGGLIALTKSLAKEVAAKNITVNAITPGFIASDMTNALTEEQHKSILEHIPLKHLGKGEDIANAVVYLASHLGNYVTGQILSVNGGMSM